MAHPTLPEAYPLEFFELGRAATAHEVVLNFPTRDEAFQFQMRWGAFKKALRAYPKIDPDLAAVIPSIAASKKRNDTVVIMRQINYNVDVIRAALSTQPTR